MRTATHLLLPFSLALLGVGTLPGWAQTATVQSGAQEATVLGNNNQVTQIIYQYNLAKPGRGFIKRSQGTENTATVQQTNQSAGVSGSNNQVLQESIQTNQSNPGHARGHDKINKDDKHTKRGKKDSDD